MGTSPRVEPRSRSARAAAELARINAFFPIMPLLGNRWAASRPFEGLVIGISAHLTTLTAALVPAVWPLAVAVTVALPTALSTPCRLKAALVAPSGIVTTTLLPPPTPGVSPTGPPLPPPPLMNVPDV